MLHLDSVDTARQLMIRFSCLYTRIKGYVLALFGRPIADALYEDHPAIHRKFRTLVVISGLAICSFYHEDFCTAVLTLAEAKLVTKAATCG
jgi:hypothetical protein